MPVSKTFSGKLFHYEWSFDGDLILIFPKTRAKIKKEIIEFIKAEVSRGAIQVGASITNPPRSSLGYLLIQKKVSPKYLSHILPLLEETGYLIHWEDKGFWVEKVGN